MTAVPFLPGPAEFEGKTAVVTGGSDGLGRHLAQALVALGSDVFFCGTDRAKGDAVAQRLGPRAHFTPLDLRDPQFTGAFVEAVGSRRGRIDFLVNNAATDPRITFAKATVEDFDQLIAVNLRSYFVTSRAALPFLKQSTGRAIVNVSTTNCLVGLVPFTVYNASKSGIIGFTRSLARELGPLGIRVNAVSPGWIMTDRQLREHVTEPDKQELLAAQSLKFLLTEEHVTPLTLFLLSSASAAITGQNIIVDGGKVMQ